MRSTRLLLVLLGLATLVMTGCSTDWFFVKNLSTYGDKVDDIIVLITAIAVPGFLLTITAMVIFVVQYRRGKGNKAEYIKGDTGAIVKVIIILDVVVLLLDLLILFHTLDTFYSIDGEIVKKESSWILPIKKGNSLVLPTGANYKLEVPNAEVLEVNVTLSQFSFTFSYPGKDGILGTDDDIESTGVFHVPVGKKVVIHITATDVIHSFFVNTLRLKQDAIPGRTITRWFEVDKEKVEKARKRPKFDWNKDINGVEIHDLAKAIVGMRTQLGDANYGRTQTKIDNLKAVVSAKKDVKNAEKDAKKKADLERGIKGTETRIQDYKAEIKDVNSGKTKQEMDQKIKKLKQLYENAFLGQRLVEIACAEICGADHTIMNAWLIIDSKEGFKKWMVQKIKDE